MIIVHEQTFLLQNAPGFVLESADSVRFGSEYSEEEREWNRRVLFGELLCGLLIGEQFWTNAVFAFDSRGAVEVLGAVARAFQRKPDKEQFLPFMIAVYPGDRDTWENTMRPWQNPGELYLKCYAHRLNKTDFQLSATNSLDKDFDRRKQLANEIIKLANTGGNSGDIETHCDEDEARHLKNIFDIDRYFRSWLGNSATSNFQDYIHSQAFLHAPIRLNRSRWEDSFIEGGDFAKVRYFLDKAEKLTENSELASRLPAESLMALRDALKLPTDHIAFNDRSRFRLWLREQGFKSESNVYRILTELVDGHYIRTQQSELTFADREVTSPASQSTNSQLGENWASATMQSCLKESFAGKSWQFINEINTVQSNQPLQLDLDNIATHFADYVANPQRRSELQHYHQLLHQARQNPQVRATQASTSASRLNRLADFAIKCCNNINDHLSRSCNVSFQFNINDPATGAGSLTFVYLDNYAISQCTGDPQAISDNQSEGSTNSIIHPSTT